VDRTIVLSGDTSLFDGMEEVYAGADILFHEAYSFDPKTNPYDAKAPVSVSYMDAFHTSTEQLAGVLKKVNPKVTVIYHYVTFTPANATDQEQRSRQTRVALLSLDKSTLSTCCDAQATSEMGHKQTSRHVRVMSVIPLKADIHQRGFHVRSVPKSEN
jgi:hypothetical protein